MRYTNSLLELMYRCKIEPTGEILTRIENFPLPMDPTIPVKYKKEREIAIKFPETELRNFLRDYDNYCELLNAVNEHPQVKSEMEKLIILVRLLN